MTYDEAKETLLATVIPHVCVRCGRRSVIPERSSHFCVCGELLLVLISTPVVAKTRKLSQEWTCDYDQELEVNFHSDLCHDDDDNADLP